MIGGGQWDFGASLHVLGKWSRKLRGDLNKLLFLRSKVVCENSVPELVLLSLGKNIKNRKLFLSLLD